MLSKNRPEALFVALAAVKLGATAGMLNYNQRGDVLEHSLGDSRSARCWSSTRTRRKRWIRCDGEPKVGSVLPLKELDELAAKASTANPSVTAEIQAKEKAFYIFTSGTTGMPKASLMSHFRWLKSMSGLGNMGVRLRGDDVIYCCLPLYHNNALTVTLSLGARRRRDDGHRQAVLGEQVLGRHPRQQGHGVHLHRRAVPVPAARSRRRTPTADNSVKLIVGNGLRPEIWEEFTERFGISRVAEFYGASECNIAFINALNMKKTAGICPLPYAVVQYDEEIGQGQARRTTASSARSATVRSGLLLSKITDRAPFDGYSDDEATEKKMVRDGFKDGDALVRHRRPRSQAGLDARRIRRPAGRHLPLEGRERRHDPGRGCTRHATRQSTGPSSTASRCRVPTARPAWPR